MFQNKTELCADVCCECFNLLYLSLRSVFLHFHPNIMLTKTWLRIVNNAFGEFSYIQADHFWIFIETITAVKSPGAVSHTTHGDTFLQRTWAAQQGKEWLSTPSGQHTNCFHANEKSRVTCLDCCVTQLPLHQWPLGADCTLLMRLTTPLAYMHRAHSLRASGSCNKADNLKKKKSFLRNRRMLIQGAAGIRVA